MKKLMTMTLATAVLAGSAMWVLADPGGLGGCGQGGAWGPGMQDHAGRYGEHRGMGLGQQQAGVYRQRMMDRLSGELQLSEQQRGQVEKLMAEHWADRPERFAEHQSMREQMLQLDPSASDYPAQVESLAKQRADRMAEHMVERAKHHAELFALLTPEQQQRMRELQQSRGDHHRHFGGW